MVDNASKGPEDQSIDYTDKQRISLMEPSLENLIAVCEAVFKNLDQIRDCELIMAIGNTGCGKSTMISSLVFGPEMHELTSKKEKKEINGVQKSFYKKVID